VPLEVCSVPLLYNARWVDEQVVVDGHLISSRKPDDIPAFSEALIKALAV